MKSLKSILQSKGSGGFAKSSAVYFVNDILQKATGFMLIPLYTAYFLPEEYGLLSVMAFVLALLVILGDLGQSGALVRFHFIAEKSGDFKSYIASAVLFILGVSAFLVIALFGLGPWLFDVGFNNISFYPYGAIVTVTFIFSICNQLYLNVLRAKGESVRYGIHSFSFFLLNIGGAILAIVVFDLGVIGKLSSALLATAVFGSIGLFFVTRGVNLWKQFSRSRLKELVNYGLPAVPHLLAAIILNLADRYVIERYHDMTEVGLYSLAYQLGSIMLFVALAFDKAWGPFYFSKAGTEKGETQINQIAKLFLVAIMFISFLIVIFMDEVFMFIGSDAYQESLAIIPLIAVGLLFKAAYFVPIKSILFNNSTKVIPLITGIAAIVNLGLNFLMVPSMGGFGAALATGISYLLMFVLVLVISRRYTSLNYHAPKVLGALALIVLGYVSVLSIQQAGIDNAFVMFLIKCGIVVVILMALIKSRIVTKNELINLKKI
ncbi:oligosaccharide flippase family protein [Phaeocystidibacter luteus]|uniref:Polysaccharide biosynthesis protein n=1 Tax=Phaeocystidibacter luteus TaxID=911197 RepID=A0A6N6RIV7_9FLAO|nr:oligosaccharide flippase family protein [Phaeocystidibacter luteus]KAB2814326.1 polysaccharide biosynthesis protein [Phaeocystidibacter luteus]